MTTTASTSTYGDAVRKALDDLPARQYLELVDGLDEHLDEVASDYETLVKNLGEPEHYAAELRASARYAARAAATAADTATEPRKPLVERKTFARGALVAIVLVFVMFVANGELVVPEVALIVAIAFALSWLVRRLIAASHLAPATARRAAIALPIGAVVFAALLGAQASDKSSVQYIGREPANQFVAGDVAVPNIVGLSVAEAAAALQGLSLDVQFSGVDQSRSMVVTAQSPPPGTITMAGTVVIATLDRRSALPTPPTTALPTPTAEPAPISSAPSSSVPS